MERLIDCKILKELLIYEPETGFFFWKKKDRARKIDVPAGTLLKNKGYITIGIYRKIYRAHNLACLYMTGSWPNSVIDHINGDRSDNRWCNLRDVSLSFNQHNRKSASRNNKLKTLGVRKYRNRYRADIGLNGKSYFIGNYDSLDDARRAYFNAKRMLHEGYTWPRE